MKFESELRKLGLTDKEAGVYLASLELGPSPAQRIARKAHVVRATTYVIIESLMERGLMTKYKEGKKTLFSAEPPRQLLRLLEKEQDVIKEKQHELEVLLPELQLLMKAAGDQPSVRYFSGREGLHAMRQEIIMYSEPGSVIYNFTPMEHLDAIFPQEDDAFVRQRAAKRVMSKTIFTTRSPKLKELLLSQAPKTLSQRKYVPLKDFPSTSGMTIFGDRIAIGSFAKPLMGVVIESAPMAEMMRRLFDLAWLGANKISGKEKD